MYKLLNYATIIISLLTATGVFIHDARIDRATFAVRSYAAKGNIKSATDIGMASDVHTHPEKAGRTLSGFTYQSPGYPPRVQKIKRYMQQNIEPRGRHAFDNHHLPLVV